MRAQTKKKHEMGRRFAVVIGVAAVGVMALVAQTGAQTQAPTPRGQAPPTCKGKPATIVGTEEQRDLKGTQGPDVIVDLGGNDLINGGPGNDLICAGKGNNAFFGGRGNDTLLGQAGRDTFISGGERCEGGKGHDVTWADCVVEKSIEKSGCTTCTKFLSVGRSVHLGTTGSARPVRP
jgi:Ca2+-binding RTX toxin-like protein